MAVEYPGIAHWAVNWGSGYNVFPTPPNDMDIIKPSDSDIHINATENTPRLYDIVLKFNFLTGSQMRELLSWWRPNRQLVKLNYASGRYLGAPVSTSEGSGWLAGDCVWRESPLLTKDQIRGVIVYNVALKFYRLEWDGAWL